MLFFASSNLFANKVELNHSTPENFTITKILSVTIDSSINPATFNYLDSAYKQAEREGSHAILIKINTPGGLVTTTKDILASMGKSHIPTFVWVTPEGASASSAGAIIASGAHVLAMSSGTNMGAATPVQMSKGLEEGDLRKKAINDLVALVQSLSESRGRNAELFGKMIREAASYKAKEAHEKKLIDFIADTEKEFFEKANGQVVQIFGKSYKLNISPDVKVDIQTMDLGQRLLNILASPDLSYIMFMLGAALIYFEFQTTGFIAGALGALCLILAGIGFQVLPLNFGALGLIILAFVLFILESFITSHGLLSITGLASLLMGSLFLYRTDTAYIEMSKSLVYTTFGITTFFVLAMLFYILRERRKQKVPKDFYTLVGKDAHVVEKLPSDEQGIFLYQVKVGGEIWHAKSHQEFEVGDKCSIKSDSHGFMLRI